MRLSTDRVLTTHVGRLPAPRALAGLLEARDRGDQRGRDTLAGALADAVGEAVNRQVAVGIDIPSDGELSKRDYGTYFRDRLCGLQENPRGPIPQDIEHRSHYRAWSIARALLRMQGSGERSPPVRAAPSASAGREAPPDGPVGVKDLQSLELDIAHLTSACSAASVTEGFMNSVSPGALAAFQQNRHYSSHRGWLTALARAMRQEYQLIVKAGLLLQVDCPDLAMARHTHFKAMSDREFLNHVELHVDALNEALADIPADRLRLHLCWGYYEGPHVNDIESRKILPIVLQAKPMALSIEGANPRHDHEWEIWKTIALPVDKILIAGVIAPSINSVEHPRLVCQRICRYASVVGKEKVIAATDCGFGAFAGHRIVASSVSWMKLKSLTDGARLASQELWGRSC